MNAPSGGTGSYPIDALDDGQQDHEHRDPDHDCYRIHAPNIDVVVLHARVKAQAVHNDFVTEPVPAVSDRRAGRLAGVHQPDEVDVFCGQ
jgi:hypothetical protein